VEKNMFGSLVREREKEKNMSDHTAQHKHWFARINKGRMLYGTNSDLKKRKNYTLINLLLLFCPYRSSYFTTTTPCMVMLSCLSFAYISYQIAVLE
jgi:hypothetical protein